MKKLQKKPFWAKIHFLSEMAKMVWYLERDETRGVSVLEWVPERKIPAGVKLLNMIFVIFLNKFSSNL